MVNVENHQFLKEKNCRMGAAHPHDLSTMGNPVGYTHSPFLVPNVAIYLTKASKIYSYRPFPKVAIVLELFDVISNMNCQFFEGQKCKSCYL